MAATVGPNPQAGLAALTVGFQEPGFNARLATEHRGLLATGFFDRETPLSMGPSNPQALNRYAYVLNNPVRYADPDGHCGAPCAILEQVLRLAPRYGGAALQWAHRVGQRAVQLAQRAGGWVAQQWLNYVSRTDGVGAANRLIYEASEKHGTTSRAGGYISAAPRNGQAALDTSVRISENTTRRVGIDYASGEFVVFDETRAGIFHGHVRTWEQLTQAMQNALREAGLATARGKIIE
jgi:hypothetical protein